MGVIFIYEVLHIISMQKKLPIIELSNATVSFKGDHYNNVGLSSVSLKIFENEFVLIYGPSGSGKSTLLHTLAGLQRPTKGTVKFYGIDVYKNTENELNFYRKQFIGLLSQQLSWIKYLNVQENIAFPLLLCGIQEEPAIASARSLLKRFNLLDHAYNKPLELSQGQQQKALLGRALIMNPDMLLADEPTGNLDTASGEDLMKQLKHLADTEKKTIIMATHNESYIKYASRIIRIKNGTVTSSSEKAPIV